MAQPLARSESIRLLEETVSLIRQAPPAVLVMHWMGSVPFALALLFAWSSVSNSRTGDAAWAAQALVLTLLLIWMNCWRAVYAGKLRRQLSGGLSSADDAPWTARRVFRMASVQAFAGATKLVVLPFCVLILFPWSNAIAFYRYVAVLAGREDPQTRRMLTPRQIMDQARRLASFQPGQGWAVLALLFVLQLVLTLNLALVMAALPQVVRILTGVESSFSRSGLYFAFNPTFVLLVLAVSWLAFDPFAQAVYSLRCFEAESRETGEDLRSGLRRIRAATPVPMTLMTILMLLLMLMTPLARAEISPGDLQASVDRAMQSPAYDWRFPPAPAAANTPGIVKVVDRIVALIRRGANGVGDLIRRFLEWLFPPQGSSQPNGGPPGTGLNWTVAALLVGVVMAGALFAWQRQRSRRARPTALAPTAASAIHLEAVDLAPDALPEDQWLELADRCLVEQDFRLALRALYLACLAWLGRHDLLSIHPGKTNHEYETELNRRARAFPAARPLFAGNVTAFERAWYGLHPVSAEEVSEFRRRTERLKAALTPEAAR